MKQRVKERTGKERKSGERGNDLFRLRKGEEQNPL